MKVLFVVGPGEIAGIQRHLLAVTAHLPSSVVAKVVFLFGGGPGSRLFQEAGVDVEILEATSGHQLKVGVDLLAVLWRFRPDVIHIQETHFLPLVLCGVFPGARLFVTEHCSLEETASPWRTWVLYRLIAGLAAGVTAVSGATREAMMRRMGIDGSLVQVVWNCVDLGEGEDRRPEGIAREELGLPQAGPLIGAVGRLAHQKGWLDFVDVCERISLRLPSARFVIVGTGPEEKRLRDRIACGRDPASFHLLGARSDGARIIGALDMFLLTSIHEELPTTVLEALAGGTPVVGFLPDGGMKDMLELPGGRESLCIVAGRRSDRLADAAIGLWADPDRRRTQSAAGKDLVRRHFHASATAMAYVELYERTLASDPYDSGVRGPRV